MNRAQKAPNLPTGWALASVGDVGEVKLGRQRSPDKRTGRFPTKYLRAANISASGLDLNDVLQMDFTPPERERFRLNKGDVILAEASGSPEHVGRAALWNDELDDCCYQNTVIRFRPFATQPEYALIMFRHLSHAGVFASAARGLGIQHLGSRRFSSLDFHLPPAEEQVRIVREARRRLTALAEAEMSLRSAAARVEEQERAIYAAAVSGNLVDLVRGINKQLGEPMSNAPAPESTTDSNSRDPTERLQMPIGAARPLPTGWSWSTVRELGSLQLGVTKSPKREAFGQPTEYLRTANIGQDGFNLRDIARMGMSPPERERFDLRTGDLLVVEASGSASQVGRSSIWRGEVQGCSYQNHLIRFRSQDTDPEYLDLVLKHYRNCGVFADQARGVGVQHLGVSRFGSIPVPVPPRSDQGQIATEANRLIELSLGQSEAIRTSLSRVEMMETEVLAAAVNGELVPRRNDAEPASELLAREGTHRTQRSTVIRRSGRPRTKQQNAHEGNPHGSAPALAAVIGAAGRPVELRDVFSLAGYDRNSPSDVEAFYVALRRQLGKTVRLVGDAPENGMLELI